MLHARGLTELILESRVSACGVTTMLSPAALPALNPDCKPARRKVHGACAASAPWWSQLVRARSVHATVLRKRMWVCGGVDVDMHVLGSCTRRVSVGAAGRARPSAKKRGGHTDVVTVRIVGGLAIDNARAVADVETGSDLGGVSRSACKLLERVRDVGELLVHLGKETVLAAQRVANLLARPRLQDEVATLRDERGRLHARRRPGGGRGGGRGGGVLVGKGDGGDGGGDGARLERKHGGE